jgi:hypothetical protein
MRRTFVDEVAADLPALDAFAARTVGRRDQFDDIRGRISAVRLPRDAFGYVPGVGGRIHDAYEEFVDSCADAAAQITDSIYFLSQGVRRASAAYADSDRSAADRLRSAGGQHPGLK